MSHNKSPRFDEPHRIELIVAVGHNDSASVLEILQASDDLRSEIGQMDIKVVLWPSAFPTEPGIYLFSGKSAVECIGLVEEDEETELRETVHRCRHHRLEYLLKHHEYERPSAPSRPYFFVRGMSRAADHKQGHH